MAQAFLFAIYYGLHMAILFRSLGLRHSFGLSYYHETVTEPLPSVFLPGFAVSWYFLFLVFLSRSPTPHLNISSYPWPYVPSSISSFCWPEIRQKLTLGLHPTFQKPLTDAWRRPFGRLVYRGYFHALLSEVTFIC